MGRPTPDNLKKLLGQLAVCDVGECLFAEPLSRHTTWHIGGPADLLVEPFNVAQVARVMQFVQRHALPLVVIGQGSNLLFDDSGLRGVVLKIGQKISAISLDGRRIFARGGAWVPDVAQTAMRAGLAGLEHIIGIPGTIGGLVLMNGGSQRRGIGENVCRVEIVDRLGQRQWLNRDECHFSYRSSALQGLGAVVVGVDLECATGDRAIIRRAMLADLFERRQKFPRKEPNCGSVFLSTGEMHTTVGPPGKIIEAAGLKGLRVGQAEVSRQHANFIINTGGAKSREVLLLIEMMVQAVERHIGFTMQCEVRYVSPSGQIVPADQVFKGQSPAFAD